MLSKKFNIKFIITLLQFILIATYSFSQTKELDIYNEWSCTDSSLNNEREFFLIKDYWQFTNFWNKTSFKGKTPLLDFEKYMVLVWAPGYTRRDCSKISLETLLYKDGCILALFDFNENYRHYNASKLRPVKAFILPKIIEGDFFIYKKVKKSWQNIEWKPIFAIWDMDHKRKRPFEYVSLDVPRKSDSQLYVSTSVEIKENNSEVELNSQDLYTTNSVSYPKEERTLKPVNIVTPQVRNTSVNSSTSLNQVESINNQKLQTTIHNETPKPIVTASPITNKPVTPEPSNSSESLVNPSGMGDDPLFGSEFDITF